MDKRKKINNHEGLEMMLEWLREERENENRNT